MFFCLSKHVSLVERHLRGTVRRPYLLQIPQATSVGQSPTKPHVLMFSCLNNNLFFCSSVFQKNLFSCSHVSQKKLSLCSYVFKHPFSCLHNKKDGSEQVLPIPNRLSTN